MFSKQIVKDLFNRYTLVRLYADRLPAGYPPKPSAEENLAFQETFGNIQRPFYIILEPLADGNFKLVDSYKEGRISSIPAFVEFLQEPLSRLAAASGPDQRVAAEKR